MREKSLTVTLTAFAQELRSLCMDEATRRRIEEYVRPLAAGLDGVTHFRDTRRIVWTCEKIAGGRADLDRDLLYLLAVFSGQERWVSRMGHRSRTEMFLSSLGIPGRKIQALFRGLTCLEARPSTPEQEVAHDAVKLDEMGARGIARKLQEGRREGLSLLEMAAAIEEAARAPLRTEAGEALAGDRRRIMLDFARQLIEEETEPR